MSHVLIYDPKGEPFEIGEELASQLILNKGWSRTAPPVPEEKPEPVVAPEIEAEARVKFRSRAPSP